MVLFHRGSELVSHFAGDGACADELAEHFPKFFGVFEPQEREDFFDVLRDELVADFEIGGEEVPDGGAVRDACVECEVVAHSMRYGGACLRDGHAGDCRGEHEFFVQDCIDGRCVWCSAIFVAIIAVQE